MITGLLISAPSPDADTLEALPYLAVRDPSCWNRLAAALLERCAAQAVCLNAGPPLGTSMAVRQGEPLGKGETEKLMHPAKSATLSWRRRKMWLTQVPAGDAIAIAMVTPAPVPPSLHGFLHALAGHMARAGRLRTKLAPLPVPAPPITDALAQLSFAAVMVAPNGRVVWANEAAKDLSQAAYGVGLRDAALVFASAQTAHAFAASLRDAAFSTRSVLTFGEAGWAVLRLKAAGDDRSVIVITAAPPNDLAPRLQDGFSLTPAEADIAVQLIAGRSAAAIAKLRQTSVQTVRIQIKSILHKTGFGRQVDLLRLRRLGGVRQTSLPVQD